MTVWRNGVATSIRLLDSTDAESRDAKVPAVRVSLVLSTKFLPHQSRFSDVEF